MLRVRFIAALAGTLVAARAMADEGSDVYRQSLPRVGSITDGETALSFGPEAGEFTLAAPSGWILDRKSGAGQGLGAVFYPKGGSWQTSPAVLYVKTVGCCEGESLDAFIEREAREFTRGSKSKVTRGAPLKLGSGRRAEVRHFSGGGSDNFESVAYVREPPLVVIVVLSARTEKDRATSRAAFIELVGSYRFAAPSTKRRD